MHPSELASAHERLARVLDWLDFYTLMLTSDAGDWADCEWLRTLFTERDGLLAMLEVLYLEARAA